MCSRFTLLFTNTLREEEFRRRSAHPAAEVEPEILSLSRPPLDVFAAPPLHFGSVQNFLLKASTQEQQQVQEREDKRLWCSSTNQNLTEQVPKQCTYSDAAWLLVHFILLKSKLNVNSEFKLLNICRILDKIFRSLLTFPHLFAKLSFSSGQHTWSVSMASELQQLLQQMSVCWCGAPSTGPRGRPARVQACVRASASSQCPRLFFTFGCTKLASRLWALFVQIVLSAAHTCTRCARLRSWKEFLQRVSPADVIQDEKKNKKNR